MADGDLQKTGVRLVAEGGDDFFGTLRSAGKAVSEFAGTISKQAGLVGFAEDIKNVNTQLKTLGTAATGVNSSVTKLGQSHQTAANSAKTLATNVTASNTSLSTQKVAFAGVTTAAINIGGVFGDIAGKAGSLAGKLGGLAASGAARGLSEIGNAAGAAIGGIERAGSAAFSAAGKLVELGLRGAEAASRFAISFGKDAVKAAMDFDQQMSEVAAVAGATPAQLAAMSEQALHLGAVFPVSAKDAAEAMSELAKAGFNAEQTIQASSGVVELASATHYSMADSATYLANAINQFGLQATDANRVTDLLAQSANASAVDVKDLAQTFAYVGPVAQAAGFSIEDVAKATSVMGNAGIKGTSAGTGLKSILSSLVAPSDKAAAAFKVLGYSTTDATGKTKPLQEQLKGLRDKFKGLSDQQKIDMATKIVGKDHMSKLLALMNATDDSFNQVSQAIDHADGAGQRMATTMNDNLAGAIQNLQGSFETLQIKAGRAFEPILKDMANFGSEVLNKMVPLVDVFAKKVQETTGKAKTAFLEFFSALEGKTIKLGGSEIAFTTFTNLGGAIRNILGALSSLGKAIAGALKIQDISSAARGVGDAAKSAHPFIDAIANGINKLAGFIRDATPGIVDFAGKVEILAIKAFELYQKFSPLSIVFDTFQSLLTGGPSAAIATFTSRIGDIATTLQGLGSKIADFLKTNGPMIAANLGTWTKNFVEWVANAAGPLLVELGNLVVMLLNAVAAHAPEILNQLAAWGKSFIDWLGPQIPPLLGALGNLIGSVLGWIGSQVGPLLGQLAQWGQQFLDWIGPQIGPMLGKLGELAGSALNWVGQQVGPLLGKLGEWGQQFVEWVGPRVPEMLGKLGELISHGLDWIGQQVGPLLAKLGEWGMQFVQWIGPRIPGMLGELGKLVGQLLGWILSQVPVILGKLVEWGTAFLAWVATNVIPALPGVLANILLGILNFIANAVGPIVEGIGKWATGMLTEIGKLVSSLPAKIGEVAKAGLSAFTQFGGDVVKWASELPGKILDELVKLPGQLFDAGKNMIQQLINGITSLHIKLPHINISWGSASFGPVTIPVPNFDVQWYAKGGIFGAPTLAGIGEAGPEAVLPLARIVPLFADAMKVVLKDPSVSQTTNNYQGSRVWAPVSNYQSYYSGRSSSSYTDARQYNLNMQSMRSTESIRSDFGIMEVMS
jgi:TP901 family phage tail tape measure protein